MHNKELFYAPSSTTYKEDDRQVLLLH